MAAMNSPSIREYFYYRLSGAETKIAALAGPQKMVAAAYGGVQSAPSTRQNSSSQPHCPSTHSATRATR